MAALICARIGQLCSYCGKICEFSCNIVSKVCGSVGNVASSLWRGPFCIYGVATFALNMPSIVIGVKSMSNGFDENCRESVWLIIDVVLCLTNIAAAWYISAKSQNPNDLDLQGNTTTINRTIHILCYDPVMAVFILLLGFYFMWLGVGMKLKLSDELDEGGHCNNEIIAAINRSIALGYSFFFLGFIAFCCSLCVACCDGRRYDDTNIYQVDDNSTSRWENPTEQISSSTALLRPPHEDVENNIPVATPVDANSGNLSNEKYGSHARIINT